MSTPTPRPTSGAIALAAFALLAAVIAAAPLLHLPAGRGAGPADLRAIALAEVRAPLTAFLADKARHPAPFDWSDDGCSHSPDHPFGFDFHPPCQRHDFGYRNLLGGLRLDPSPTTKRFVDRVLAADLDTVCRRDAGVRRNLCRMVARWYVVAVEAIGRPSR